MSSDLCNLFNNLSVSLENDVDVIIDCHKHQRTELLYSKLKCTFYLDSIYDSILKILAKNSYMRDICLLDLMPYIDDYLQYLSERTSSSEH